MSELDVYTTPNRIVNDQKFAGVEYNRSIK